MFFIINNLALSPLIYVSSVVNTGKPAIKEINNIIPNFMWDNIQNWAKKHLLKKLKMVF